MSTLQGLVLEGLGRSFGAVAAVRDVTLSIEAGERCAILGPNGAGKTTLFNLIAGDLIPDKGRIVLDGRDVTRRATEHRVRLGMRRTYQTSLAFAGLNVRECLFLAVRGVRGRRYALLRTAGNCPEMNEAERLARSAGLDGLLNIRASELSHGVLRQVEIAMARAGDPRLLLLDEPAAGLSAAERGDLLATLRAIPREVTLLMIEHDVDFALAIADRVLFMRDGALIRDRTPAEIASDQRILGNHVGTHMH